MFDEQAKMFRLGWKTIEVIKALDEPRRRIYSVSPLSAENTLSLVPLIDAVQIKVPSGLTVINATSDSWAKISD